MAATRSTGRKKSVETRLRMSISATERHLREREARGEGAATRALRKIAGRHGEDL